MMNLMRLLRLRLLRITQGQPLLPLYYLLKALVLRSLVPFIWMIAIIFPMSFAHNCLWVRNDDEACTSL